MASERTPHPPQQIQVSTADELSRGRFSNNLLIVHSQEEFILDWMINSPSGMHLVSRVILTPGHMKRVVAAMAENVHRYEQMFGQLGTTEGGSQTFH